MGKIEIAVDNSILGNLGNFLVNPDNLTGELRDDIDAFRRIIKLDHEGIFEIGLILTTAFLESLYAGEEKRNLIKKEMGSAYRPPWPAPILNQESQQRMDERFKCLSKIMQDSGGVDSKNLIVSLYYTSYYLTMDYRYIRQFRAQETRIKKSCGINVQVLSPAEFLNKYKSGGII